jgi:hypothetical protein
MAFPDNFLLRFEHNRQNAGNNRLEVISIGRCKGNTNAKMKNKRRGKDAKKC